MRRGQEGVFADLLDGLAAERIGNGYLRALALVADNAGKFTGAVEHIGKVSVLLLGLLPAASQGYGNRHQQENQVQSMQPLHVSSASFL